MPERRADKNGKVSTRWVKTGDSKGGASVFPSPVVKSEERYQLANHIANILRAVEIEHFERAEATPKQNIGDALFGYSTDSLKLIKEGTPFEYGHLIYETIMEERNEEKTRYCVKLMKSFGADAEFREIEVFANGLLSYTYFKDVEELSSLEGEKLAVAQSLCKISTYIHHFFPSDKTPFSPWNSSRRRYITDEVLVQSIVDYPERVDEVIEFISDRDEVDGAVIRQYLENRTALRSGVL